MQTPKREEITFTREKFSNTAEQTMPTLAAIPNAAWLAMSVLEIACSLALVAPAVSRRLRPAPPTAAAIIAAEMVLFTVLHLRAGSADFGPVLYWLIVAALCAVIVVGRLKVKRGRSSRNGASRDCSELGAPMIAATENDVGTIRQPRRPAQRG